MPANIRGQARSYSEMDVMQVFGGLCYERTIVTVHGLSMLTF